MPTRSAFALILSLALVTTACSSPMKTPDIKQNPHPMKRYEITMTIEGALGPFDSVSISAGYQVINPSCVPMREGSGATPTLEKSIPIVLTRISNNAYKGIFYTDLMQDEDYFGLGICHWELTTTDSNLQIRKSDMSSFLSLSDVVAQKPVTRYFSNRNFDELSRDTGSLKRSGIKVDASNTFSITLVSKEDFQ